MFKDPDEIPEDYYTEILEHTDLPIAFLEIGWHASDFPPGWESSGGEQARYLDVFFTLTEDLYPVFNIWSFMFDPNIQAPFNSMGLIDNRGVKRPSWNKWLEHEMKLPPKEA